MMISNPKTSLIFGPIRSAEKSLQRQNYFIANEISFLFLSSFLPVELKVIGILLIAIYSSEYFIK